MTGPDHPPQQAARRVIVDALNVAYWCGSPPSLRLPVALMTALLADGHRATMYFDASARYRLGGEAGLYARLLAWPGYCVQVPSRRSADGIMLRDARAAGACIVSRDRYRDYRRRYRKLIDDPQQLMTGTVADDHLLVPALALSAPLPATAEAALSGFEQMLPQDERADSVTA